MSVPSILCHLLLLVLVHPTQKIQIDHDESSLTTKATRQKKHLLKHNALRISSNYFSCMGLVLTAGASFSSLS